MSATTKLSKRARARLAKTELLLFLAGKAEEWKQMLDGTDKRCLPPQQWPADDPFITLCRTYQLTPLDLAKLCHSLGGDLERRALRAGYDEHLDPEG
jgi:hypothetical protein